MALITMPTTPSFSRSTWGLKSAQASAKSPFTGQEQLITYDKACWYATLTLPPMRREQAGAWTAFFMALKGRENTFLIGDPDAKTPAHGGASSNGSLSGTIAVNATSGTATTSGTMAAGDYIQFGSGSTSKLYMLTADKTTGSSAIAFEPKVTIAASGTMTIVNPKCVMRMDSPDLSWSANQVSTYGISFSCSEAL